MSNHTIIQLPTFTDERGSLTALESALPFNIIRWYWIYGADGQTRGGHRHRYTQQALVALNGEVSIFMDDGVTKQTIILNHPNKCLLVEPKDWHTMHFGDNSVLLVMSSHPYDRSEYIDTPYETPSSD